ncbi:MAG: phosphatidylglycerophosphatase A [candidate division Zixibacteria bacterium]|nr:phosphatidylglycerophosphatase A [candidate division Zixibacteria bacterium]
MSAFRHRAVEFLATGAYSGYSPIVSGTVGSIPPWLIAYFALRGDTLALAITAVITTIISVWAAGEAEIIFGHDSKKIVSDEWAGMFIALLFLPYSLVAYLISFFAFRFLDVVKIWPARALEKLPRGWGVTMDDVAAGVQANIATHLTLWALTQAGLGWLI